MLGNKNAILVDRTTYAFRGKWKNPRQDIHENIFYFVSNRPTFVAEWNNGREELKQEIEITCFGEHPFVKGDIFELQNGEIYKIESIGNNYFESNIAVRDMLKSKIESQVLILR